MNFKIALKITIAGKTKEIGIGSATNGLELIKLEGVALGMGLGFEFRIELK